MTFEQWWLKPTDDRDGCSPQDDCLIGLDKDDVQSLVEDAYKAGWNACADTRCDDTYGEYLEHERSSI